MSIKDSVKTLKNRLTEYSKSEAYLLNDYDKDMVNVIEIAINLYELAERKSIDLTENDKKWYRGEYEMSRTFDDPKWQDISELYSDIVKYVYQKYFP